MAEIEAAANVGSFRGMNVHIGGSMGTQIPAYDGNKMSYLTGPLTVSLMLTLYSESILGRCRSCCINFSVHYLPEDAQPLPTMSRFRYKRHYRSTMEPSGEQGENHNFVNSSWRWNGHLSGHQVASLFEGSSEVRFLLVAKSLKMLFRAERMELNQWANSERHGYMLNCEYDYSAHLVSTNRCSLIN